MARPLPCALVLVLLAGVARADVNQQNSDTAWKQADRCSLEAFKKFPDYTADSNAKRDAARRECLRNHKLPETGAAAPPAPVSETPK